MLTLGPKKRNPCQLYDRLHGTFEEKEEKLQNSEKPLSEKEKQKNCTFLLKLLKIKLIWCLFIRPKEKLHLTI